MLVLFLAICLPVARRDFTPDVWNEQSIPESPSAKQSFSAIEKARRDPAKLNRLLADLNASPRRVDWEVEVMSANEQSKTYRCVPREFLPSTSQFLILAPDQFRSLATGRTLTVEGVLGYDKDTGHYIADPTITKEINSPNFSFENLSNCVAERSPPNCIEQFSGVLVRKWKGRVVGEATGQISVAPKGTDVPKISLEFGEISQLAVTIDQVVLFTATLEVDHGRLYGKLHDLKEHSEDE